MDLFSVNDESELLEPQLPDMYHTYVSKLLYLEKITLSDISTSVSFLTTRIMNPNFEDWKKMSRCMRYLNRNRYMKLILHADNVPMNKWCVYESYEVHPYFRSHTGFFLMLGKGSIDSYSLKQKLNT